VYAIAHLLNCRYTLCVNVPYLAVARRAIRSSPSQDILLIYSSLWNTDQSAFFSLSFFIFDHFLEALFPPPHIGPFLNYICVIVFNRLSPDEGLTIFVSISYAYQGGYIYISLCDKVYKHTCLWCATSKTRLSWLNQGRLRYRARAKYKISSPIKDAFAVLRGRRAALWASPHYGRRGIIC